MSNTAQTITSAVENVTWQKNFLGIKLHTAINHWLLTLMRRPTTASMWWHPALLTPHLWHKCSYFNLFINQNSQRQPEQAITIAHTHSKTFIQMKQISSDLLLTNGGNHASNFDKCFYWWCSIVVRPPVLPACFPYPCARLTAGRVTTLWVKRPLSVSQQGQLSLPSLRGRLNE